ncbi:DEAD/H helicase [Coprinopsis cinerea okayama7|uniref:DEAD/H helicase n=1 Tax=Coprinopsis cinerea (strain Okayama-7 / 130 / ATCC MYA-4618 / FGSC 9003) TaxID=240176 RepID=A8NG25_COPC7|nr:DEAD/H helicase [Coprinopsis cinerea okayama7\|eukprot:XP_001833458.2 DEAD/H helicase [Coprinopsis cinerea okayama7\
MEAINTVLAFVASKKQLAVTFSVIRTSVEAQLKHPLEIASVAELKALLPDVIRFSYIPKEELRVNGDKDKDFELRTGPSASSATDEGHVLILEMVDNLKGKQSRNAGFAYSHPPNLTIAALQKLIDKRNDACKEAINNFLAQLGPDEDPVQLLKDAGHDLVPVNPSAPFTAVEEKTGVPVPSSAERSPICDIIEEITSQSWYQDQILHRQTFEAREARLGTLDPPPSETISQALLDSRKISKYYSHQAQAIQAIRKGKHVVASTSTASGKSLIYQVPLLMALEQDPSATAIFVYPTKALAQDQKASLEQLIFTCRGLNRLTVATYDGDTAQDERIKIRETASVIFTNFDTIHTSILPHEEKWRTWLKRLKLFVVDELHYYTGLFGSHVALILRRFRRICAALGNRRVQFVSCTATLANPARHMEKMFGLSENEVHPVTEDGAPSNKKDFLVWNPPLIDPLEPSLGTKSAMNEATSLMRFLMKRGVRVILFCKIRKICELAMKTLKADLSNEGRHDILKKVRPYRGGYSREDRRRIEADAFAGELLGIVSTNALELGIDIGVLDTVIMLGFPMTIPSFRQQAGRAGRRSQDSLVVLVVEPFAIDQYYAKNPTELFDGRLDELMVDIDSKVVLEAHLQCAAFEMPLSGEDEEWFGPSTREICEQRLLKDKDGWYHTHPNFLPYPSAHVSIRGAQEEKYLVVEVLSDGRTLNQIEEVEVSRAMFEVYEGGVFLHQGSTFIVKEISHDSRVAKVLRAEVNYITSPRDFTNVDAVQTQRIRRAKACLAYYGKVHVEVKVFGFFKIRNKSILDAVDLDTPSWERDTSGFWIDVPKPILELLRSLQVNVAEAIHAAEHAFLNQFPLSEDVKTECKAAEKEYRVTESTRKRPARLIFYDAVGKGGGVSSKAFDEVEAILDRACTVVCSCSCEDGCAKCVQSLVCKEANQVSSKVGAEIILKGILGQDISYNYEQVKSTPYTGPNTIVEAPAVKALEGVQIEESEVQP